MKARKVASSAIPEDKLKVSKEEFESKLNERIELGNTILNKSVHSDNDFQELKYQYESWNNFNMEMFKRHFTEPNNSYYKEYCSATHYAKIQSPLSKYQKSKEDYLRDERERIRKKIESLNNIKGKIELIEVEEIAINTISEKSATTDPIEMLSNIFNKFHKVAKTLGNRHDNRTSIEITDEYDVQDLLHALLKLHFDDVRPEEYTPSYAGNSSKEDFKLDNEQIVIETKMTNDKLKNKEITDQLLIDIGRYKSDTGCKTLVCFIYDSKGLVRNPIGLIKDLQKQSTPEMKVIVFINPML